MCYKPRTLRKKKIVEGGKRRGEGETRMGGCGLLGEKIVEDGDGMMRELKV